MSSRRPARTDRALGVQTSRKVAVDSLGLSEACARTANRYEPTPIEVFDELMISLPIDPAQYAFVDLGSGKGRVVMLACEYPFRQVVGIEASAAMHGVAQDNLLSFAPPWRQCSDVSLRLGDAAEVAWPDGPLVLYMYNPFRAPVMLSVLGRLKARAGDPIWVAYYEPTHADLIGRLDALVVWQQTPGWIVYGTNAALRNV